MILCLRAIGRLIVCGGRHYSNYARVALVLDEIDRLARIYGWDWTLVHGGASGADLHAEAWAIAHGVKRESHPARWDLYGKAAGPIRNHQMLTAGVDLVIAFPGGRGTHHMCSIASAAGVQVWQSPE